MHNCNDTLLSDGYVAGSNGKWCNRDCHKSGKMGHTAKFCPEGTSTTKFILSQYLFSELIDGLDISYNILLLDTGPTNTTTNSMKTCTNGSVRKCNDDEVLYAKQMVVLWFLMKLGNYMLY